MGLQTAHIPATLTSALEGFWPAGRAGREVSCVTVIRSLPECAQCGTDELVVLTRDATSSQDIETVIADLAKRQIAAVLLPDAPFSPEGRSRLRTMADRHGVTVGLLGAHVDPVLAANTLSRAHGSVHAPAPQNAALHAADSLQELMDILGRLIGNSVTIETANHELLGFSAMQGPVDRVREETILQRAGQPEALKWVVRAGYVNQVRTSDQPVRIPPNLELGFSGRVAMRVAAEGETLAIIWATDTARQLTGEDEASLVQAAHAAATILLRQRDASRRQEQLVTEVLEDLVHGRISSPEGVRSLAASLGWNIDRRQQAMVVEIDHLEELRLRYAENGQRLQRLRDRLTEVVRLEALTVDPDAIVGPRTTGVIVLFTQEMTDTDQRKAASQRLGDLIVHRVAALIPEMTVTVGIGREFAAFQHTAESVRQAELAAQLGMSLWGGNRATDYSDLGIHRALFALQQHEEMITPALQRIMDYDERHGSECVHTLDVYFACMGRLREAAAQLNIHRNTLEYRIRRIEEVAGVSLDDPTNRLALELGIRVLELKQTAGLPR